MRLLNRKIFELKYSIILSIKRRSELKLYKWISSSFICLFLILLSLLTGCDTGSYTMDDFKSIEKIDAHVHINTVDSAFLKQAETDNFKLLTINTDYPDFPPIEEQQRIAITLSKSYPGKLAYASTFHMKGWDAADWREKAIKHLDSTFKDGAIAVKFWKNIGMDFRDKNKNLIMINDPKFDPIFAHLKKLNVPVIGHQGEPRECWLPFDKMVIMDLKEYYKNHPQYHMYLHPDMPSYEEQMHARDSMLEKNQDITFMGAHLASLEWSVDEIAKFLDRFPNAVVDIAARMNQLQYQTKVDREKVEKFFMKYQDRILYGTDITYDPGGDKEAFKREIHRTWLNDWKYLATDSTMNVSDFEGNFKGLKLPVNVIDKVYRLNAERTFRKAWKSESIK